MGPIFLWPLFGEGCSVRFHISLYLPRKYDTPPLEAFPLGLAPEKAPLCIKRQEVSALVYWGRKIWLLLYSLFLLNLIHFLDPKCPPGQENADLSQTSEEKRILLKNPGFSVDNHKFSCVCLR